MLVVIISDEQAKQIASIIAFDIRSFIDANKSDYEKWLKQRKLKEKGKEKIKI